MGYQSDIRIRLLEKDYKKLKELYLTEYLANNKDDFNLFDKEQLDKYVIEENSYTSEDNKTYNTIYFGWNGLKWYNNYEDVKLIEDFVKGCDKFAFCRIGEETDDMDYNSFELEPIFVTRIFDDYSENKENSEL